MKVRVAGIPHFTISLNKPSACTFRLENVSTKTSETGKMKNALYPSLHSYNTSISYIRSLFQLYQANFGTNWINLTGVQEWAIHILQK